MNRLVRHRQPAQAMVGLIGMMMLTLIATVAVAADWGMFFVLQRELQSAADAGALAAAWYDPVCSATWAPDGCQPHNGVPNPKPGSVCAGPRPLPGTDGVACEVAQEFANANLGALVGMCDGFDPLNSITPYPAGQTTNHLQIYVVHIDCNARHLMGNVLPNVPLTMPIGVNAAATVGYRGANGDVAGAPNPPDHTLITRLFPS